MGFIIAEVNKKYRMFINMHLLYYLVFIKFSIYMQEIPLLQFIIIMFN